MSVKFIAFYLPQYHPIEENDTWYGKGFTEWVNVAKAKKLFKNHYQPHIPADLGFYDLRLRQTRLAQIQMANEYGIDGFCYWHYWFGMGKQLLDLPLKAMLADKNAKFPFCLAWANHSWEKKLWDDQSKNELIVEQRYDGYKDYYLHFMTLLNAFKDERYIRVDGKLLFIIYQPLDSPEIKNMIKIWRSLAKENNLNDFYFVGKDYRSQNKSRILVNGFDAIYNDSVLSIHSHQTLLRKIILLFQRKILRRPTTFPYKEAIKYMLPEDNISVETIPLVAPNWDHSPRSGNNSIILTDSKPKYFEKLLNDAVNSVRRKPETKQIIIIKSWNEWGEGNHLEPDIKFGKGYLEVVKRVKENL